MKVKAKIKSNFRRVSCVCLTGVMAFSLAASAALALANENKLSADGRLDTVSFNDVTGKVDLTGVALQNLSPSVLENAGYTVKNETRTVIVTLNEECIIDTLPGGESVSDYLASFNGGKQLRSIQNNQADFLNSLSSMGIGYNVVYQYNTVANAVAIKVNTQYLSKIKSIKSVKSAVVSETYAYPEEAVTYTTDALSDGKSASDLGQSNPSNVYETGIYKSQSWVDKGYDGSGMTVAVLDTGLDYTHPAFQNMPEGELGMDKQKVADAVNSSAATLEAVRLSADRGKTVTADELYINDKVPFAYDYADKDTDVYPAYSQHGVHVAGIVAGDAEEYTDKDGNTATDENGNKLKFKGVAPNAQLVICKVFTDDFDSKLLGGAETEDIVAALEDCVTLGVDVINMSLGTTAGFSTIYLDGDSEGELLGHVYEKLRDAGISVMCAASNDFSSGFGSAFGTNLASNPDSGTVGSPSTFTGALSIASINGQLSPFMLANAGTDSQAVIYYTESSDANSVKYDFIKQMLGDSKNSETFKYVVVPNIGQTGDYTASIRAELADKKAGEKVIAVIKRGSNTFKDKIEIAARMGADAAIVYNNVAGTIGMSLGDLDDPIPAVSVSLDDGNALVNRYDEKGKKLTTGLIEINRSYQAGPFMNDYSSWGTTSDLKLKPEITSHGGEITSTVSGGYDEMSGTSMATPNLAGFVALLRGKLKQEHPDWDSNTLNQRVNQIIMSTAVTVYDPEGKAYSPRKQGSGLATLDNVFTTNAYLYTTEAETHYTIGGVYKDGKNGHFYVEDGRPKFELGDDPAKTGVYNISFYVKNEKLINENGDKTLSFKPQSIFMTESLSPDGFSVAEKAHYLEDIPAEWKVNGVKLGDNQTIDLQPGESAKIEVTLTLSAAEKQYIDKTFVNGMFVEGFLKLVSQTEYQCDLALPFMGFYGDWKAAPMLDYSAFDITEFHKDASYTDETRPQAQIWATQAYATYYNEKYTVPMGGFMYLQDEYADQIYVEEEHTAISCFNDYYGDDDQSALKNYLTTTEIKALYTGLLRNAELVTYDLYDEITGELILSDCIYRVSKAYAGAGSTVPANVKLELKPEELGLVNNGKYRFNFHFYFDSADEGVIEETEDNTFTMTFYVDYEAPVLVDSRIRYYDYKENNKDKQRVYLDLDIYDNHYAQSVILCYSDQEYAPGATVPDTKLFLATEYVTPIYNANKNGTTTVSIEITDFYEKYQNRLYIQIDDYALNHSVYAIRFSSSQSAPLPDTFEIEGKTEITIGLNETYKVGLSYEGNANVSNFDWTAVPQRVAKVNNGEIFGAAVGTATVTVKNPVSGVYRQITVHVVDSKTTLALPSITFGTIENSDKSLVKASGTVKVNAGEEIKLDIETDPWYYPYDLNLKWSSSNTEVATVDQNGNVKTLEKKGTARIEATILNSDGSETSYTASVTLSVQDPFTVSNNTLTAYHGLGGDNGLLIVPDDKNIINIGENAFEDNDNVKVIILPKTVRQINEKAFYNCRALEEIYFISQDKIEPANSSLSLIMKDAFQGCTSLKKVDLSNCKTITVAARAFAGCTALEEVVKMDNIGTMNERVFAGCTSLKQADITGLHDAGYGVFMNCSSLESIKTAYYSSISEAIFKGCGKLTEIEINSPVVAEEAFAECAGLTKVTFGVPFESAKIADEYSIGAGAFSHCTALEEVDFNGKKITSIGDSAFADCTKLSQIDLSTVEKIGIKVFEGTHIDYSEDVYSGAIYSGTTLVLAPSQIANGFEIREGTTEIAAYAFADSSFADGFTLEIPASVKRIGEYAFAFTNIKNVKLNDGLKEISLLAFAGSGLEAITIPQSVTVIGEGAFMNCKQLASVTFAGARLNENDYLTLGAGAFNGCSALVSVQLPELAKDGARVYLADSVFANNTSLKTVDLKNVTEIGGTAFYRCTSLENIDLRNAKVIGLGAFAYCEKLTSVLGLDRATDIGAMAFANTAIANINLSDLKNLGDEAFYGAVVKKVIIPAGLETFGAGAFENSKVEAYEVAEGSHNFFAENGVLYRLITGTVANGTYELCAYPTAKLAALDGAVRYYDVKDGTVSIQAFAFAELANGAINEVELPYSLKTIGNGAFYFSGITSYVFESISAPALLTERNTGFLAAYGGEEGNAVYTLQYINFNNEFYMFAPDRVNGGAQTSTLKISYPTNGTGYDNYVYSQYFGTKVLLGELMDDTTRELKNTIESLESAQTVAGWTKLDKNENLAMVTAFSEKVKNAHAIYNTINSDKQLELLGAENIQKLFDIESALKAVKSYFGIKVSVSSISLAEDSSHKTEYKVGEKFDMTGLKLIVTYDDYSTEPADMSQVKLASGYDEPLTELNRYVNVTYQGKQLQIRITVSEGNNEDKPGPDNPDPETGCKSGCGSTAFFAGGGGAGLTGLGIVVLAVAVSVIVKMKRNTNEN